MKNLIILLSVFCFFNYDASAQIEFGVKAGISVPVSPNANSIIVNRQSPRDEFLFNAKSVGNGITLGVFAEQSLSEPFFLRGELLYNQFETTYELNYTWNNGPREFDSQVYTEKTARIDMPITLGVRLNAFEITSGVVARYILSHENEMAELTGYEDTLNPLQLGLQAGVGLNLGNLNIGLAYQMDFTNYGDHMMINGNELSIQNSPSRLVATIGYRF